MSKRAVEWVKSFEASRGVWMPRSHWRTLRVVAQFYHEGLGCAFATVRTLAEEARMSDRHLRRTIAELDEMGIVRRNSVQRSRDKSDSSNEYELPAYRVVTADAAMRSRIFSVARERIIEQAQLELPARTDTKCTPWMEFLDEMRSINAGNSVEGGRPATDGVEGGCPAIFPVDCARKCPREADALSGEPRTPCPPVDLAKYFNDELSPPYAPPRSGADVESEECGRSFELHGQPTQPQRPASYHGGSQRLVFFPRRQRSRELRTAEAVRRHLDGENAALWDEATRVMRACGVSPESSGRKIRRAVLEALRLECERSSTAIASAGVKMVERWRQYEQLGTLRFAPLGFTRFIAEGEWLRPEGWRVVHERVERFRRGGL